MRAKAQLLCIILCAITVKFSDPQFLFLFLFLFYLIPFLISLSSLYFSPSILHSIKCVLTYFIIYFLHQARLLFSLSLRTDSQRLRYFKETCPTTSQSFLRCYCSLFRFDLLTVACAVLLIAWKNGYQKR